MDCGAGGVSSFSWSLSSAADRASAAVKLSSSCRLEGGRVGGKEGGGGWREEGEREGEVEGGREGGRERRRNKPHVHYTCMYN